jgi:ArsR family transcriptional regulator
LRASEQDAEELYRLQAEFCKGMAHPKRIFILTVLEGGEKTVNELAEATRIPQPNLSQHLSLMRQTGIVKTRRLGANVYYATADHQIVQACELVRKAIEQRVGRDRAALGSDT